MRNDSIVFEELPIARKPLQIAVVTETYLPKSMASQ
jgi:hypothetical protein